MNEQETPYTPRQVEVTEEFDIISILKTFDEMGFRIEKYDTGFLKNRNDKMCFTIWITKK